MATYFVAVDGNDAADGSTQTPFRTIGFALAFAQAQRIVIRAGRYAEGPLAVSRPVEIIGTGAILEGHLDIAAEGRVLVHGLRVLGGIAARRAAELALEEVHAAPGSETAAFVADRVQGSLRKVTMDCGSEACALVTSSTLAIEAATMTAAGEHKRGLRVDTSSVTVRGISVTGTNIAQVHIGSGWLRLDDALLEGGGGSGIAATGGRLAGHTIRVNRAGRMSVLLSRTDVSLTGLEAGGTSDLTVGIQGGRVFLIDATLLASDKGTVSVTRHSSAPAPVVSFTRGVIRHGAKTGVSVDQGRVTVRGTRFEGAPGVDVPDAVVASGPAAERDVGGAHFETPGSFAVGIYNDAFGTVSATISRPGTGGVIASTTAGAPVIIKDTRVESCGIGSGVVALDALDVRVESVAVSRCPEAAVLAGDGSRVKVTGSRLTDNAQYGVAAFGGAEVEVGRTAIRGSSWAMFASCSEGSRVTDRGDNHISGPITRCP